MIHSISGVLIQCDATVKEIILSLNGAGDLIVADIDDEHLFVNIEKLDYIHSQVQRVLDQNTFRLEIDGELSTNTNGYNYSNGNGNGIDIKEDHFSLVEYMDAMEELHGFERDIEGLEYDGVRTPSTVELDFDESEINWDI